MNKYISITTLLTHTVAYSTRHSFRPNTNYHLIIFFNSYGHLSESCKILTFKVNILCQDNPNLSFKNVILGAIFLLLTFFENFNFQTSLFSKITANFWQLLLNFPQDF